MSNTEKIKFGFKIKDVVKEGRITWNEINKIRQWLNECNLIRLEDEQIVHILIACNRDVELTKRTIKEYVKMKNKLKHLFTNRDINLPELQAQINVAEYCIFPRRTDENYMIIFHKLQDTTYNRYHFESSIKIVLMMFEASTYNSPSNGLIAIGDMTGITFLHLTRLKLDVIKQFFDYLQNCLPVIIKAVHVFNTVPWIEKILTLIKPFINKELLKLIKFHTSDMDFNEFYRQYVPKKCLPKDYGGLLPSTNELHVQNVKFLESMIRYFINEEQQRIKTN